ncbi:MAG TPA: tetratricopeptide repeat protein, partial [Thermoanaerobaculia bacterium]|nr:tetratricopeptide repeat protein [Thermoanaerobaculia bacterium]
SLADLNLEEVERERIEADQKELGRPPETPPANFETAVEALCRCGLLAPATGAGPDQLVCHRWASPLLAELDPLRARDAHQRAAGYWLSFRSSPRADEKLATLIEARFHSREAKDPWMALSLSLLSINLLSDLNQGDRAAAVCEETLGWLSGPSDFSATLLHQVGVVSQRQKRLDVAERYLRRSLEVEEAIGNESGMVYSFHQLGRLAQERGEFKAASTWYRRALALGEKQDGASGAATYHQLGMLARQQGDYEEAERWTRRSLEAEERTGNAKGATDSRHQLGMLARARGDYKTAEELYEESLRHDKEIGNVAGAASSILELGGLTLDRGHFKQAEKFFLAAQNLYELCENPAGQASAYHGLGTVSLMVFDLKTAEKRYRRAIEINESIGNPFDLAPTFGQMGKLALAQGKRDEAREYVERALRIDRLLGNSEGMSASLGQLGLLAMEGGDPDSAERLFTEALDVAQRIGAAPREVEMLGGLAALESGRRNDAKAVEYALAALKVGVELASPQIGLPLQHLVAARERLGDRRFLAIASEQCDRKQLEMVESLMSQWERHLERQAERGV